MLEIWFKSRELQGQTYKCENKEKILAFVSASDSFS